MNASINSYASHAWTRTSERACLARYSCARSLQSDMDDSQGMREPPSNPGSYDRKSKSAAAYSNILCTDQSEYIYIYIKIYVCCTYVCMYPVCYTELFSEISYVCMYISAVRRLRTLRLVPSCGAKRQRHGACCHEVQFLCEGSRNLRGKAHVCSQGA